MPKFYRVYEDDFKANPFCSDMDEDLKSRAIIIEERFKEEFIAEQVGRFTRHLLSILHEMPARGKHNPFNCIASKYPRFYSADYGETIMCPVCNHTIDESEWNNYVEDLRPCCTLREYEFEMEEEEE